MKQVVINVSDQLHEKLKDLKHNSGDSIRMMFIRALLVEWRARKILDAEGAKQWYCHEFNLPYKAPEVEE